MERGLVISDSLTLPAPSLSYRAVRSGGPGGQNVNKVATKVELRFDPALSPLSDATKLRLAALAANQLDADGRIVIVCEQTRSQRQNLELARERVAALVRAALVRPKKRRPTKPSRAAKARRLDGKRRAGEKKRERGQSWD